MKKTKLIVAVSLMATLLSGCGLFGEGNISSADIRYTKEANSIDGGTLRVSSNLATGKSADYSNTYITGDMADYSYDFKANGNIDKKETVLAIYEKINAFAKEKGGYTDSLYNNYYGYALDEEGYKYSDREIKYSAAGTVSFDVEIPKEEAEAVIDMLDHFIREKGWTVTQYRQTIQNYEGVEVVDKDDDTYWKYTQEEIDRMLKYATVSVSLDYKILRNKVETFGAKSHNFWLSTKDVVGTIFGVVIIVAACIYAAIYLIILPGWKIVIKSTHKYRKKHDEFFDPKKVECTVNNENLN